MAPAPLKRKMSFATVERYEELDCLKDIYSETPNDEVLEQELREPLFYKCSALAKFLMSKNPITLLDAPVVLRAIEVRTVRKSYLTQKSLLMSVSPGSMAHLPRKSSFPVS